MAAPVSFPEGRGRPSRKGDSFGGLVIMNSASVVGRLSPGLLLPHLGRHGILYLVTGSAACASALIFSMIALKSVASFVVVGVLYGLCAGMYIALSPPLIAFLTDDMSELGLRMGVFFAVVALGGLIGPPITGALLTANYIWWRPAVFCGVAAGVGALLFLSLVVMLRWKHGEEAAPSVDSNSTTVGAERKEESV
ncbi:hypothetical protein C8F01DRAFT_1262079 [Mycena amicta]|nr:hypothetical protein C8F01DRAFT_1262079 [Mycena amicta]